MDLQEIRGKLDEIDKQLVELTERRLALGRQVAEYKIGVGKAVLDKERERQKIAAVRELATGDFNKQAAEDMITQMIAVNRKLQYGILAERGKQPDMGFRPVNAIKKTGVRVVYQGVEGAYAHGAALQYFGDDADVFHVRTWEEAMTAVERGEADYAVIPIENSSAGAVTDNYDLMISHENVIVAETFLPVSHCLLGLPDAELADVKTVYSHPQALMQCSKYLNSHLEWRQISVENTAVAARKVVADSDKSQAAVASQVAGKLYGLKELAQTINHNKENTTRFLILSRNKVYRRDAGKISICFELPHRSGTLYNMLGNFIYNGVNMVMIESRPIPGRNWEYRFFVDIEGNLSQPNIQNALLAVSEEAANMRVLGNY